MLRILLFCFFLSFMSSSFSQKITKDTPITDGSSIFLKYPEVFITPPKDYYYLENISSFVSQKTNTTISVAKKKGISYKRMIANLLSKQNKLENAKMIFSEEVGKGMLFVFQFEIQGEITERMMYIMGDEEHVWYAMANYKQKEKQKYFSILKKAVLSIKF